MTTPFWCLPIAILLPWVLAGVGDYFRKRDLGSIDNKHPRAQVEALEGVGARVVHPIVYAANLDMLRSLTFFVGAGCCIWLFVLAARA